MDHKVAWLQGFLVYPFLDYTRFPDLVTLFKQHGFELLGIHNHPFAFADF